MIKIERPQQPDWLKLNYKKWGIRFRNKLANPNLKNDFIWATHQKAKVNKILLPILRNSTNRHCAFCDDAIKKGTIEHFRPSSRFPKLSYVWHNLFPCCSDCQEKRNEFSKDLLKPDKQDYKFNKYFLYNSISGKIDVNPGGTENDRKRAEETIRIYKLNRPELIEARMDCFEYYQNVESEKRPFRFIFII